MSLSLSAAPLAAGRTELHNPIEFAAGLTTAANDHEPLTPRARLNPLADIAQGFGIVAGVFGTVTVLGWAVVQVARGWGMVS